MSLRPLHDRVIVKRLEEEKKSLGGIIIPMHWDIPVPSGGAISVTRSLTSFLFGSGSRVISPSARRVVQA